MRGADGSVLLRGRRRAERAVAEEQGVGTFVAKRTRGVPTPLRWGSGVGNGTGGGAAGGCGAAAAAALSSAAVAGGGGGRGGEAVGGGGVAPFATPQPASRFAVSAQATEQLQADERVDDTDAIES